MAGVAANAPSPEGWQQAKPLIEQLYVQQDRPLKEVRAYLAEHRKFLATERMFKQRLKEWGFDRKKVKAAEWRHMLRVTRQRRNEGKDSAFRVNGKVIVWSNIRKHLKRKKKTEDEFLSAGPEAEAVEDVVCYTPPGSPHLSVTQTTSTQILLSTHRSTYTSQSSTQTSPEQSRVCLLTSSFSPISEQSGPPTASLPDSPNPSVASESSSTIPGAELQSIALRPINIKRLPPLDEAAALRISLMMTGSHNRSIPLAQAEYPPPNLALALKSDRVDGRSSISHSSIPEINKPVLLVSTNGPLSDEDTASRWVVYYFQACMCESQGDHKGMRENVEQASQVFEDMLATFNPYLLTGLTLMTSILYFHGHVEILKQFLEDSCQAIGRKFVKTHPIIVPYRYMLVSVCGNQTEEGSMSDELVQAYHAFELTWGKVHPNTLTALYYYGCSLLDAGKFDAAEVALQNCCQRSEENLGYSHFLTVWTLATISRTLSTSDRAREAEAVGYLKAAINRCRRMMHEEHPYCLELNRHLAMIHLKLGNLAEVESLYRFVLDGRIKVLGLGKQITQASIDDLHDVLVAQNKLPEAAQLRAEMLAMKNRGESHSTHGISY